MYEALCRYASTIVGSWDTAEDLVQEVFVRLWERHRDQLPLREPKAYLFRAVRNSALNHISAARNARRNADADVHALPGSSSFSPDNALNTQITREAINTSINALPDRQEEVFRLSRNHHLTYAEIAEVLGISVKTVETHMGRALAFLRNRLSDQLE
jgi:RNA polymerase sigma-70 factor (ECF subfamily)